MFTPAAPLGGYAGFKVFERTIDRQFAVFSKTPELQRAIDYFRQNVREISSAAQLVADRRLLVVALGAFGLESEISKRAIIRRVLEESPGDAESFVNRLNDPRWRAFAQAFNFATGGPAVNSSRFQDVVVARYAERSFEQAVGEVDPDFRLALNFRREIKAVADSKSVDRSGWFQILGQQPLRRIMEAAFGLPPSLARLDVDRQREILEVKAEALFGSRSPAIFKDAANIEVILRRYFASSAVEQVTPTAGRGAAALAVLTGLTT
jgi:hypothetical protein